MTRLAALFSFIILAACTGTATPDAAQARLDLGERETLWLATYGDADSSRMAGILAEGFVITFPDGNTQSAEELLAGLDRPGREASEVHHHTEDRQITVDGDTAILRGIYVAPGRAERPDMRMFYTDTWVWRGGEWKVLASQLAGPQ